MRTSPRRSGRPGYISYVMVLITSAFLTALMFYAYRRATATQTVQSRVTLRMDYSEKEDAVLRSIIAIAPNRAMRAMQNSSAVAGTNRDSLTWQSVFSDALAQANARSSMTTEVKTLAGGATAIAGNTADSTLANVNQMFTNVHGAANTVYITPGLNRTMGTGYPAGLTSVNGTVNTNDLVYPIVSNDKTYSDGSKFAKLKYPKINFGYANPGDDFVAKRNWWAFSMDLAANDRALTGTVTSKRQFVLSIYEIPSQLSISAPSFMSLGKFSNGNWQNVTIAGNIFASNAKVEGNFSPQKLASRRGMTFDTGSSVGGQSFTGSPFAPGVREQYEVTSGEFFPVSMPSESGRSVFVPINRGSEFFDRFANDAESSTLSTTTWNNYSSGAMQCAMRLDVSKVTSATNKTPTEFSFSYMKSGTRVSTPLTIYPIQGTLTTVPSNAGWTQAPNTTTFTVNSTTYPYGVDVMYGRSSGSSPPGFASAQNKTGTFTWSTTFPSISSSSSNRGWYRARQPFTTISGPGGKICVAIYPKRFARFLTEIGADGLSVNNSIVVNSDWTKSNIVRPSTTIPTLESDYGLVLDECDDLTGFTTGFSVVSNFRLYIASDFNTVPKSGTTYPACSLFAPEKRYGLDSNPYSVSMTGQIGSLASDSSNSSVNPYGVAYPLDAVAKDGSKLAADKITVNLKPITELSDLPPINMMNWLVLIEERRAEFW